MTTIHCCKSLSFGQAISELRRGFIEPGSLTIYRVSPAYYVQSPFSLPNAEANASEMQDPSEAIQTVARNLCPPSSSVEPRGPHIVCALRCDTMRHSVFHAAGAGAQGFVLARSAISVSAPMEKGMMFCHRHTFDESLGAHGFRRR